MLLLQKRHFFKTTFSEKQYDLASKQNYFLKVATFSKELLSRYFFTVLPTFHSYISYLSVSYLESSASVACNISRRVFLVGLHCVIYIAQNHITGRVYLIS